MTYPYKNAMLDQLAAQADAIIAAREDCVCSTRDADIIVGADYASDDDYTVVRYYDMRGNEVFHWVPRPEPRRPWYARLWAWVRR